MASLSESIFSRISTFWHRPPRVDASEKTTIVTFTCLLPLYLRIYHFLFLGSYHQPHSVTLYFHWLLGLVSGNFNNNRKKLIFKKAYKKENNCTELISDKICFSFWSYSCADLTYLQRKMGASQWICVKNKYNYTHMKIRTQHTFRQHTQIAMSYSVWENIDSDYVMCDNKLNMRK